MPRLRMGDDAREKDSDRFLPRHSGCCSCRGLDLDRLWRLIPRLMTPAKEVRVLLVVVNPVALVLARGAVDVVAVAVVVATSATCDLSTLGERLAAKALSV